MIKNTLFPPYTAIIWYDGIFSPMPPCHPCHIQTYTCNCKPLIQFQESSVVQWYNSQHKQMVTASNPTPGTQIHPELTFQYETSNFYKVAPMRRYKQNSPSLFPQEKDLPPLFKTTRMHPSTKIKNSRISKLLSLMLLERQCKLVAFFLITKLTTLQLNSFGLKLFC